MYKYVKLAYCLLMLRHSSISMQKTLIYHYSTTLIARQSREMSLFCIRESVFGMLKLLYSFAGAL